MAYRENITFQASGNTTQQSSAVIGGNSNIVFEGAGVASVGLSNNRVLISVPAGGGNINISAGTTSNNLTAFTFNNANGITFGLNASTITASHNGLTSQSNQAVSGANGSFTFQTLSFANSNGISFSTGTQGLFASHNGLTSQSNQAVSAANGSFAFQTLTFANSNGISFSTGTQGLFASHNGLTTARASNDGVGLNTAQTNVTWTVNSSGLSINAAGYAGTATTFNGANISGSITLNSNGLNLSLSGATAAPSPVNISAGTTSNNLGTIQFNNANGVSFGLDGSTITASVNAGGGGVTRNYFDNLGPLATASGAMGTKSFPFQTLSIFPLKPFQEVFNGSMTLNTMAINLSLSGSANTMSVAFTTTARIGLYTVNSTAATLSLGLINSAEVTFGSGANNANLSQIFAAQRFLTIHSSQWSSQPVLSDGVEYYVGLLFNSAGISNQSNTMLGGFAYSTAARSGFVGVSQTAATWQGYGKFLGVYTAGTTGMPAGINYTQINKQSASANFIPHIIGYNNTNVTFW